MKQLEKISVQHSITPEEFMDFVAKNMDVYDRESILACAPSLQALSNNRTFLTEHINQNIKTSIEQEVSNPYSAPTIVLSLGKNCMLRANIWPLISKNELKKQFEKDIFVYGMAHDHNFDFLTVGYYGKGYTTRLYEYDYDKVKGFVGEKVDIEFKEETTLPAGKLMFYRKSKDIHTQLPPTEVSVSLNLLTESIEDHKRTQYIFDLEKSEITGFTQTSMMPKVFLMDLAMSLGDENSKDLVYSISQDHSCPRTRALAYKHLMKSEQTDTEWLLSKACLDKNPLVQSIKGREQLLRGL